MNLDDFNDYLLSLVEQDHSGLAESMRYSISAGGKRIRPLLTLSFAKMCGEDEVTSYPIAASIELIHTYSLIHDDLPCMDNDDERRGMPSNHIAFGECTATLAGDALQPLAFETIMNSSIPDTRKVFCASILAKAAGYKGMCAGQYYDMIFEGEQLSEEELTNINRLKTGELIASACMMGVAAACDDEVKLKAAEEFGFLIGLAFQIRDDMLDEGEENKNTYMVLLGKEKCALKVHELTEKAIDKLSVFSNTDDLISLVKSMENRNN